MNHITEKTNAELSITLDDLEEGNPVSVFFFKQSGPERDTRITIATYTSPAKGTAKPVIADTYDLEAGIYALEIWSNIDTQQQQRHIAQNNIRILDARAV